MQGKYKCKTGVKSVKKVKIKKYEGGVKDLLTDDEGNLTGAATGVGAAVSGLAATGLESLTKSGYDEKYTSQLKDSNQATGRAIGAVAGQSLNLIAPGLGTIATPLLSSAGGAVQRAFQNNKLEKIKKEVDAQEKLDEGINTQKANMRPDLTQFQAKQYSKGGTTKTKVIEIEGKKTPEIHTDKNFNLKNLGTTPHSKGGNKVVAEEGDVVFPTQNSPKKYNEVMNAIMKKDKYKLKKEQNKLPEDKASKYPDGTKKIGSTGFETIDTNPLFSRIGMGNQALANTGKALKNDTKLALTSTGGQYNPFLEKGRLSNAMTNSKNGSGVLAPDPLATYAPLKENRLNDGGWLPGGIGAPKATSKAKPKGTAKVGSKRAWSNPNAPMQTLETGRMTKSENPLVIPEKIAQTEVAKVETPQGSVTKSKKGLNFDGNNLMELAPIAYNLGQGLFGKAEKVNRKEYQPELEQYVDTSNNMRREVNQNYKMGRADARNLSAGSANNFRANAQAAANQKLSQMNSIDSQEYGKQVDVANRNVDRTNEGRKVNIDLFNNYEDLDAQNRAVKQNALATGLEQMGELGSRNKLQKNQMIAHDKEVGLLEGSTAYKLNGGGNGLNFNQGNGPSYSNNLFPPLGLNKKASKKAKGTKGIQVSRTYKLKK